MARNSHLTLTMDALKTLFSNVFHQDHSVTIGLIFNLVEIIRFTLQERNASLFKGTKQNNVKDCTQNVS